MNITSRFSLPIIKASTDEQAAYAFALRECYLIRHEEINDAMTTLGESLMVDEIPEIAWKKILKKDVYSCYFDVDASKIINTIKDKSEVCLVDIRLLGYAKKGGSSYDEYVSDFKKTSLYELKEEERDCEE